MTYVKKKILFAAVVLVMIAVIPVSYGAYSNGWNRIILLGDNALKFLDAIDFGGQDLDNIGNICLGGICIGNWSQLNGTTFNITPTTSLPATNISSGSFGANTGGGNYLFPNRLTTSLLNVTGTSENASFAGDVQIYGKLYGGSPVKIAGGLEVISGEATFGNITVTSCTGCIIYNATANFTAINVTYVDTVNLNVSGNISFPNNSIIDAYIASLNANKLFNLSALNYQIQISQANITSGITIPAANVTGLSNVSVYNESGIARNYTLTGASLSGTLPTWERIHISGVVATSGNDNLVMTLNADTNNSYLYRRVQGLTFLYQAVTVNPQKNITMEQFPSTQSRDVDIVIYRGASTIKGEFTITTYVNLTYAPYKTMGSFNYANTSAVTTFELLPTFTADSYLIVRSETK